MGPHEDTIFALATPAGRSGVAVIRVSGPQAGLIAESVAGPLPKPRRAALRNFRDASGHSIDQGLLLWFDAPKSFTGEPVVEFHLHGGHAIIECMFRELSGWERTRPAVAGEFTRRAYENGKLDLTAVEGLADLVAAETESQRRQALRQMEGLLGNIYEGWRVRLLQVQARLEAEIDFSDEELPEGLTEAGLQELRVLKQEIHDHLCDGHRGEMLRRGFRIAILGAPNVGKSSILNMLARREAAIVTPQAGTTRDVIEVSLDLGGYMVTIADTAGLRGTDDPIEAEGIRRARLTAERADLKLLVFDAGAWPEQDARTLEWRDITALCVINKIDQNNGDHLYPDTALPISALTGAGIDRLMERLHQIMTERLGGGETPGLTRERHRIELKQCLESLERAVDKGNKAPELLAEDIRLAVRALGRITGRTDVEDMLDVLFAEFCIGK
jgi:tRNA modification GTPase